MQSAKATTALPPKKTPVVAPPAGTVAQKAIAPVNMTTSQGLQAEGLPIKGSTQSPLTPKLTQLIAQGPAQSTVPQHLTMGATPAQVAEATDGAWAAQVAKDAPGSIEEANDMAGMPGGGGTLADQAPALAALAKAGVTPQRATTIQTGAQAVKDAGGSNNPLATVQGTASGGGGPNATAENTALNGLNSDIAAGQQYTNSSGAFANGAMGRVNATTDAATADALAKSQALEGGLTAPQMQAQKELNDQAIGGQLNSNLMALRGIQGAQGLRGGSAAAQQIGLLNTAGAQQQTAARQEQLDQLAAQQSGVQNFLSNNQNNNAFNTANTQYNNQQANAEAAGRLSTPLTYAGLLQGARTGADANTLAQEGANTAQIAATNANTIAQAQLDWQKKDPGNISPSDGSTT